MKRIDKQFLLASKTGDLAEVKRLLARGANINAVVEDGLGHQANALMLAAGDLNLDVCHYLLDAGIDHRHYDAGADEYPNILALVAWDHMLCRRLIDLGLDPHDFDGRGESLFVIASRNANLDLMKYLYSIGVDTGANRFYGTPKDQYSFSPLLFAAGRHDTEMTRFLLEIDRGQMPVFYKGITAIHAACLSSRSNRMARPPGGANRIMSLLLSYGADLHVRDEEGNTPLHYGCGIAPISGMDHRSDRRIIASLLDLGADPHARNNAGKRPIDIDDADLADFARGYRAEVKA